MIRIGMNARLHVLLVIILGIIIYSNTLGAPFVFDDLLYIVNNPAIREFRYFIDISEVKKVIEPDTLVDYTFSNRFAGYLTFAVNYRMSGLDVTGYHIFNISIHIINALLVYWLVLLIFRTPVMSSAKGPVSARLTAFLASVIFVSHPVQTQAVTYISQRFASLAAMFYLLSFVMYIKWRLRTGQGRHSATEQKSNSSKVFASSLRDFRFSGPLLYCSSLLSAVLAMKTKEIAFTLPFAIFLCELFFLDGPVKKRIFYLIPFVLSLAIIPLGITGLNSNYSEVVSGLDEATRARTAVSRWSYLFTEFRVFLTYLRLVFFPVNQNLDYDYPLFRSFFEPEVFLSFSLLLFLFGLGIYFFLHSRRSNVFRIISFGIFWFFLTISVESGIIPTQDVIFEHRLYLPSVGVFISIAALISYISDKFKIFSGKAAIAMMALVVMVLSAAAYSRNLLWRDDIQLWKDVIRKSPVKARPYHELGLVYYKREMLNKAASSFREAIALNPGYFLAHRNLGVVYYKLGMYDDAIRELKTALMLGGTGDAELYGNIGALYLKKGYAETAIDYLERALNLRPDYASAHHNLGIAYDMAGRKDKAEEHFRTAHALEHREYPDD